jgi:hypothetical protein
MTENQHGEPTSRRWHGLALLFFGLFATFSVQAADGELVAQTDTYEVRLLGHQDREHSMWSNRTVREYHFEATAKADEQKFLISLGGDFLEAAERLKEIRIFEDRLVVTTPRDIFVLDLRSGKRLNFLRARGPIFSPSGRFIAYREWQLRAMPEEAQGAIVSVLDLRTLERRAVFPKTDNLKEFSRTNPSDEFELFLTDWEEDPRRRCFTSQLLWSADDSRLAFRCSYYLAKAGRSRGRHDLRELAVIVVQPNMELEAATIKRFDIPDEAFLVPGVEIDATQDWIRIQHSGWVDENLFELRLDSEPWLRKRIVIDMAKDELRSEP